MTIYELLESEKESLEVLRSLSNRYPNDAVTQRLCSRGFEESAARIGKLNELLRYNDKDRPRSVGEGARKEDEPLYPDGSNGNGGAP